MTKSTGPMPDKPTAMNQSHPSLPTPSNAPKPPTIPPQPPTQARGLRSGPFEVSIGSLDNSKLTVYAQYRPKELEVSQNVPWSKHTSKNNEGTLQLEFSGGEGRTTSLEMFFDASETKNGSVQGEVDLLNTLARVRSTAKDAKDSEKRPHHCVLVFGKIYTKKSFMCVIESVNTKYTMFSPAGDPIRATVTLKLKECTRVDLTEEQKAERQRAGGAPAAAPGPAPTS